jgi:AcrR family transcriptional regulator
VPKLNSQAVERNQLKIEDAALKVFTRQGYHGTSVREIAQTAGVSLGNIYNYYPTKEKIFESLVHRYAKRMERIMVRQVGPLIGSFEPESLQQLAAAVREIVANNQDYWRLMYIDVVEFGNQHFRYLFQDFPDVLRRLNPEGFKGQPDINGSDPAVVFASVYLQFLLYYLVETLFQGQQHLGLSDEEAIAHFIRQVTAGRNALTRSPRSRAFTGGKKDEKLQAISGRARRASGTGRIR